MSDQPNSDLLNPYCQKCQGSEEQIHVITHECLEGDALRCVIKAVPDDAPLNPDDYVRVSDLLQYLQGAINVPSESATSATVASTASNAVSATASSSDASSIVVTPTPSASEDVPSDGTASSASSASSDPYAFTLTATAGMSAAIHHETASLIDDR
jgi:hypothetical protein